MIFDDDVFLCYFWLVTSAEDSLLLIAVCVIFTCWDILYRYMLFVIPNYRRFCLIFFSSGGFAFRRKDSRCTASKRVHCSAQPAPPPAWPGRAVPELGRMTWEGPKPISVIGSTGSIGTQVKIYLLCCVWDCLEIQYINRRCLSCYASYIRWWLYLVIEVWLLNWPLKSNSFVYLLVSISCELWTSSCFW